MTIEQHMPLMRRCRMLALCICATLILSACASSQRRLTSPTYTLHSPYPQDVVIAVAPLANESGTSAADELRMADRLAEQLAEVDGIGVIPLNRTLDAMQALRLPAVASPAEAHALARMLGADAILVGSITAWDPYDPPRLGLNLALFGTGLALAAPGSAEVDPRALQSASTDYSLNAAPSPSTPLASLSNHYDASNHALLMHVRDYATGRADPQSALNWQRYIKSMELYERFVSFRAVDELLASEQRRIALANTGVQTAAR